MDTLEAYWDNFWGISAVVGFIWFLVLLSFWGKKQQNKPFKNEIKVIAVTPILILCHILWFKFQHYTPYYLELYDGDDYGVVEISDIISLETKKLRKSGRSDVYLILLLSNGSKLEWRLDRVEVVGASKEEIKGIYPLDVLDYK